MKMKMMTTQFALAALLVAGIAGTACTSKGDNGTPDAASHQPDATPATGTLHASWSLTRNNVAITCADANATKVHVTSTGQTNGMSFVDIFNCMDLQGTTAPLPLDSYAVVVSLFDATGAELGASSPTTDTLSVANAVVEVAMVIFVFPPLTHTVTFQVDYGNAGGSNCATGGATDSGVGQQEIVLSQAVGGACTSLVLTGTDQTGTPFTGDTCDGPQLCMETTVVESVALVPEGMWQLEVKGLKTATVPAVVCYDATFAVNITGDTTLGSLVVPFNPAPADMAACNATKPSH